MSGRRQSAIQFVSKSRTLALLLSLQVLVLVSSLVLIITGRYSFLKKFSIQLRRTQTLVLTPAELAQQAARSCNLPKYFANESIVSGLLIEEGNVLVEYKASLGGSAEVWLLEDCFKSSVRVLSPTAKEPSVLYVAPLSALRKKSQDRYILTNLTLAHILKDSAFVWVMCEDAGSQLIVPLPAWHEKRSSNRVQHKVSGKSTRQFALKNMLSIMLDAVSREKFAFLFPRLEHALIRLSKDPASSHIAVKLLRHNAVGVNSAPNKLAVFAGVDANNFSSENANWIMDVAHEAGYEVAWAECGVGGVSSTRQGSEHQTSAESYVGEVSHWYAKSNSQKIGDWNWPTAALYDTMEKSNHRKMSSTCEYTGDMTYHEFSSGATYPLCAGNTAVYSKKLEYIQYLMKRSSQSARAKPLASFVCFDEGHYPGYYFKQLDESLASLIDDVRADVSIIIWSDHGLHFSEEATTRGGSAAHKQPLAWLLLPKTLIADDASIYQALLANSASLTTQFDLHLTFRHLLTGNPVPSSIKGGKAYDGRSQTLLQRITNPERSCSDVGIPYKYCPCMSDDSCDMYTTQDKRFHAVQDYLKSNMPHFCNTHDALSWREHLCSIRREGSTVLFLSSLSQNAQHFEVELRKNEGEVVKVIAIRALHAWQNTWEACSKRTSNTNRTQTIKQICSCV